MVKDIRPGSGGSVPEGLTSVNGLLFFSANNGTDGSELWKSNGTSDGTVMVGDINPGSGGSTPSNLLDVNGTLFFAADNGLGGNELWKYTPGEVPAPVAFRINAGGEAYTDGEGKMFIADQYANSGNLSTPVMAQVVNTEDEVLYRQGRIGERFTYSLPTGNGVYYVVLHFAETYWGNLVEGGVGSRSFNVDIEELSKLSQYDIYAKAGGSLKAVQEAFRVEVKDGVLDIRFSKGLADLPLISAIEVFPEDAFRINVAGSAYLSSKGWFLSDAYYSGGSVSAYAQGAVGGTQDDELYRSNRHSSLFYYNLPTGPGTYQVTLHFNENYWGNLAQGGEGSRRFNVNAEGERKLSGYDTYRRAGGAMHAQQEQFTVTVTDQVLSLAFMKGSSDNSADFAHVSAIEIVKASTSAARLGREDNQTTEFLATALFPNPVHTMITVRLSVSVREIKATAIRDPVGRKLLANQHKPIGEHQFQVDVSSLQKGLYLLEVQTGQGEQVLKFLKH
jgi:ELWxxDGT repeat protein